jgi:hypothetical protein
MVNIITINNIDELPNTHLYYISDINQYAIKINNIIYRGNIGNIYNKDDINNNKINSSCKSESPINIEKTNQILYCKYGNSCNNLLKKKEICNFYHDPCDINILYKKKIIDLHKFNMYKTTYKNFINTNWLYVNSIKNNKNKNMRHFGSKNNLINDIRILKLNNNFNTIPETSDVNDVEDPNILSVKNFKSQLIHDILVLDELKKNNLIV